MSYKLSWQGKDGRHSEHFQSLQDAINRAVKLPEPEITESNGTVIKERAIRDLYAAIEGRPEE